MIKSLIYFVCLAIMFATSCTSQSSMQCPECPGILARGRCDQDGQPFTGHWEMHESGILVASAELVDGYVEGFLKFFHHNGMPMQWLQQSKGRLNGYVLEWASDGAPSVISYYRNDELVMGQIR